MSQPDPSLLALVTDDPLAPKVLAAWKALALTLEKLEDEAVLWDLEDLAQAPSTKALASTLRRCKVAGLILDGGISPLADSLLSVHVATALGAKSKPKPKPEPASKKGGK